MHAASAEFCDRLGLDLPIIQAPMAGVQDGRLAIAVSGTGALGSLPCALLTADGITRELTTIAQALSTPYNVNFFCHSSPPPDPFREAAWRQRLAPYYRELGIDPATIPTGPGRRPFDDDAADVISAFRPPVVSFHFGLPSPVLLERVKAWRPTILSTATTLDEARWLESHGVDVIIAQGLEAGGHRGMFLTDDVTTQVGTFALVRQIVGAVRVPVIAAGGIADADGVAAALRLGAVAAQIGTAYLLCPEATTTALHRAALASSAARHTAITNVFSGRPARGIVNRIVREVGPMSRDVPPFPLAASAMAPLRARAESLGSDAFSSLWSGQNATGCRDVPATVITRDLVARL